MLIITINNSYSSLGGLTPLLEKQIRNELSYTEDSTAAFHRGNIFGPKKTSLINKRGEFPTGLLNRLVVFLSHSKIPFILRDSRIKPVAHPMLKLSSGISPYPHQDLAANLAVENHQACLSMPTGSGKSLVIALIIARLGVKTLVVVPTLEIKKQLTQSLLDTFKSKSLIQVENIASPRLKTLKDFDCLIIDEAHHVASRTYRNLNKTAWNRIYYRFFLTATPFRSNDNENILFESIAGEVAYQLDYKTAVKYNYIVPIESFYIDVPSKKTNAYTWAEVYKDLVTDNQPRNEIIANSLINLRQASISTLCLIKTIKHGNILSAMTGVPFANGQDEISSELIADFNSDKIKVLIGTEGILGEGIDTKPCEYVIIAGLGKAKSAFMQKCGRAVRKYGNKESGKILLFRDKSHKFCLKHFRSQVKILKDEYNSAPARIEIE